jgi:hypothetical protein
MVRIRFPPAESQVRTTGSGATLGHWVCRAARALGRSYGIALSSHQHIVRSGVSAKADFGAVGLSRGTSVSRRRQACAWRVAVLSRLI